METLQKNSADAGSVKPFPLHSQYVPAVLGARDGDHESESDDAQKKPRKKPNKAKAKSKGPTKTKKGSDLPKSEVQPSSEWQYGSIRKKYIENLRNEGKSFDEAAKMWNESTEKARYLAPVSLGQLKKRRFLEKGATRNPWYDKIHGPTNWVGTFHVAYVSVLAGEAIEHAALEKNMFCCEWVACVGQ